MAWSRTIVLRSVPYTSSTASCLSRGESRDRSISAESAIVEYAPSSVTRRRTRRATLRALSPGEKLGAGRPRSAPGLGLPRRPSAKDLALLRPVASREVGSRHAPAPLGSDLVEEHHAEAHRENGGTVVVPGPEQGPRLFDPGRRRGAPQRSAEDFQDLAPEPRL